MSVNIDDLTELVSMIVSQYPAYGPLLWGAVGEIRGTRALEHPPETSRHEIKIPASALISLAAGRHAMWSHSTMYREIIITLNPVEVSPEIAAANRLGAEAALQTFASIKQAFYDGIRYSNKEKEPH